MRLFYFLFFDFVLHSSVKSVRGKLRIRGSWFNVFFLSSLLVKCRAQVIKSQPRLEIQILIVWILGLFHGGERIMKVCYLYKGYLMS